ncbi:MAG: mechanosensitive ion channel [Candidatus Binatus sp.]|uniref:mechanosensitive ion channel family protein n=1 Tax=Candidatus Binatus sp. TaxID=2811406 RepID=UPI00272566AE|nr:mechanosensitive ion channel domain-containing protein [Candidatus Binatus sp.]MDO8433255.1 mechanosensitive ion channel [Candidatus Binatus sp.]
MIFFRGNFWRPCGTAAILIATMLAVMNNRAAAQSPQPADPASLSSSAPTASPLSPTATPKGNPTGTPSRAPKSAATAKQQQNATTVSPTDPQTVLSYLSDLISWYRHLGVEAELVEEPYETLFLANSRQIANEVLNLGFEYARAQANYIAQTTGKTGAGNGRIVDSTEAARLTDLKQKADAADAQVAALQTRIKGLQTRLNASRGRPRTVIASEIGTAQSELDLAQARADAAKAILQFESGTIMPAEGNDLATQIDELEHSIPDAERNAKHPVTGAPAAASAAAPATFAAIAPRRPQPTGILSLATDLLALQRKDDTLEQTAALTRQLIKRAQGVLDPVLALLRDIDRQGNSLPQGTAVADAQALRDRKLTLAALLEQHRLAVAVSLPLNKQIAVLNLHLKNIARWQATIDQRSSTELRSLALRLGGLATILIVIFLSGALWRIFTDKYVQDIRRRGQVMALRRIVISLVIVLVLIITFSDELGSFATVMGFAAAGIAVALQNVILSIAGYFFLIGRFGIKAGDRVQIGGVTGDVIEIGLVKLSLLELAGTGIYRQPTGRVVVFSNAIVFQPSGNFFKQAPGTSFIWNEVRLTLAPDCDYRLAEKRLLDAVDEVFSRYRDRVQSDYRHLERDLNLLLDTPKPQSRLSLSQSGLEVIIRYPCEAHAAPQIADEVSRRVLDAINREPSLRLAMQGIANIQAQEPPPPPSPGDGTVIQK